MRACAREAITCGGDRCLVTRRFSTPGQRCRAARVQSSRRLSIPGRRCSSVPVQSGELSAWAASLAWALAPHPSRPRAAERGPPARPASATSAPTARRRVQALGTRTKRLRSTGARSRGRPSGLGGPPARRGLFRGPRVHAWARGLGGSRGGSRWVGRLGARDARLLGQVGEHDPRSAPSLGYAEQSRLRGHVPLSCGGALGVASLHAATHDREAHDL